MPRVSNTLINIFGLSSDEVQTIEAITDDDAAADAKAKLLVLKINNLLALEQAELNQINKLLHVVAVPARCEIIDVRTRYNRIHRQR